MAEQKPWEDEMMMKKLKYPVILFSIVILISFGNAVGSENQQELQQTHVIELEFKPSFPQSANSFFDPMRQEYFDDFERDSLWWLDIPWTTSGYIWAIRDTTDTYGPDTAPSGYRYAGVPAIDIAQYAGDQEGYLTAIRTSPHTWSAVYVSWDYWSSFEGSATNFDGGIIEISNDAGATWLQIDSLAQGHLNPTYDARLAGTGALDTAWAYCYSTDPDWVSVSSQDLQALGYVGIGDFIGIRLTFASDPLAAGQGWFVDNARMADTPPPDLQPPVINHTPLSDTTDTLNDYTISATVTDEGSGLDTDSVYLHYQIESGPVIDVQMTDMGSDVYEADIPAQVYHTDVFYCITAADLAGNEGSTPIYNFEVTNAKTIIYDDGQPYITSAVVNVGDGAFVQFSFSDVGIDSGQLHQVKFFLDNPGQFDVCVYEATTGNPGALIDSIAGLISPGYEWNTVDITDLDIQLSGEVVVGYIIRTDSLGCLRDETLNYSNRMWSYISNVWQHSSGGGDHMIRLKVIPMDLGVAETPGSSVSVFALGQIAPNPMRDNAVIEYQLATGQKVCLNIYNVSGRLVKQLVEAEEQAGTHKVSWNGRDQRGNPVASGVYFYQLKGDNKRLTRKLIVTR